MKNPPQIKKILIGIMPANDTNLCRREERRSSEGGNESIQLV